jgi:hypothetical protein
MRISPITQAFRTAGNRAMSPRPTLSPRPSLIQMRRNSSQTDAHNDAKKQMLSITEIDRLLKHIGSESR